MQEFPSPQRLWVVLLFATLSLAGTAAVLDLERPAYSAQAPALTIVMVRPDPQTTLRGHGWVLTLPNPDTVLDPSCATNSYDDCSDRDDVGDVDVTPI